MNIRHIAYSLNITFSFIVFKHKRNSTGKSKYFIFIYEWMGQDSNLRCFCVTDLQSAALAARHTHPWGDQGESVSAPLRSAQSRCPPDILRSREQSHNLPVYHYPMATVAPAGLEPDISGLRGRCHSL